MCVVSAVIDHHTRTWPHQFPNAWPTIVPDTRKISDTIEISLLREEVRKLSEQVEYLLEIIPTLRKYDDDNSEPDCEMHEKVELVRKICEALGIDNNVL